MFSPSGVHTVTYPFTYCVISIDVFDIFIICKQLKQMLFYHFSPKGF